MNFLDLMGEISKPWYDKWLTLLQRLTTTTDTIEAMQKAIACTSLSTHTLGVSAKTFVLEQADRVLPLGATLRAISNVNGAASVAGLIVSSGPGTVTVSVTEFSGTGGPYSYWTLVLGGPIGAQGVPGEPGAPGTAGTAVRTDPAGQALLANLSRIQAYLP